MTIDDELILELIKPDSNGRITEKALIVSLAGTKKIQYRLEESTYYFETYRSSGDKYKTEIIKMTPDITIWKKPEKHWKTVVKDAMQRAVIGPDTGIAVELENDIQWDFQSSLKQVKKYKGEFQDTRVIIPDDFRRFAPLYRNEGFRVYLWRAKRRWQCLRCGKENEKEGPVTPKCSCGNHSQNEFRLIGLKDTEITEFP